jgi:adenosine kinase
VRIAVTGSIATDHLMTFDGRFADSLLAEKLERVAVSFLVSDLQIRRGGVAANIAFGLGTLGLRPLVVAAVGQDFGDYRSWLEAHGVDCSAVLVTDAGHTSRFVCTTDRDQAQIASFYPGAMTQAREIQLAPLGALAPLDLVVVSPNDPEAMLRHTQECRRNGIPFVADPSQQLSGMDGERIRALVDGAAYLFSNDYEAVLIERKTGWSAEDVLERVGVRVTTHGEKGVVVEGRDLDGAGTGRIEVPVVPAQAVVDPTGVGDAFRAGYLAALSWGLPIRTCAEVGSTLATLVIETVGTQEYRLDPDAFLERIRGSYGVDSASAVAPHLPSGSHAR